MQRKPYVKPTIITRQLHAPEGKQTPDASREVRLWENIDAGSRFANRRSVPRYPFSGAAAVTEPLSGTRLAALVSEISAKGCYLESLDELPKNTFTKISILRNEATFETWGRIAYVQAGTGSGVAFFDTRTEQQRILDAWIAEISAFLD
jgi:hypothetical protein